MEHGVTQEQYRNAHRLSHPTGDQLVIKSYLDDQPVALVVQVQTTEIAKDAAAVGLVPLAVIVDETMLDRLATLEEVAKREGIDPVKFAQQMADALGLHAEAVGVAQDLAEAKQQVADRAETAQSEPTIDTAVSTS